MTISLTNIQIFTGVVPQSDHMESKSGELQKVYKMKTNTCVSSKRPMKIPSFPDNSNFLKLLKNKPIPQIFAFQTTRTELWAYG
jgi:hypothetical protein